METGQAFFDSMAIVGNMLVVVGTEGLSGGHARLVAIAHLHGRKVTVGACAVPVAMNRFGVERRADSSAGIPNMDILSDAVHEPPGDP